MFVQLFFFQAEDGIRDAQESRGLGDVYKRQLQEYLEQPYVGVIATLRKDGMPYTVPVWWLWKPDGIWITGTYNRVWCKQLLNDPRASLCIESGPPMTGHVEFDGRVTAYHKDTFDIWPISKELATKYVGRGEPANDDEKNCYLTLSFPLWSVGSGEYDEKRAIKLWTEEMEELKKFLGVPELDCYF